MMKSPVKYKQTNNSCFLTTTISSQNSKLPLSSSCITMVHFCSLANCCMVFKSSADLQNHQKSSHICGYAQCSFIAQDASVLTEHIKSDHVNGELFQSLYPN